jgi:hypothetical protein
MLVENYPFTITRPGDIAMPYLPITVINQEKSILIAGYYWIK